MLSKWRLVVSSTHAFPESSSAFRIVRAVFIVLYEMPKMRIIERPCRLLMRSDGMSDTTAAQNALRSASERRPPDARACI
eukprot:1353630-Prymnesium_polylepis.1